MTAPIVVALDPEQASPEAETLGVLLSRATGGELVLVTVFPIIAVHSRGRHAPLRPPAPQRGRRVPRSAGASLEALAVAAPLPWMSLVEPAFDGTTLEAEFRAHLARCVEGAAEALDDVSAEAVTLSGDPVDVIAGETAQLDLLVCGSRGHGPVEEVVLGGVSHALTEAAHCPVVVVPRP